jgi:hypothetical protein
MCFELAITFFSETGQRRDLVAASCKRLMTDLQYYDWVVEYRKAHSQLHKFASNMRITVKDTLKRMWKEAVVAYFMMAV